MEQVNRGQAIEQLDVRALGSVGVANLIEETRERVDGHRTPGPQGRLGDQHGQSRLARADRPHEPQPAPGVELLVDRVGEPPRGGDDWRVDLGDRRSVERDVAIAARDDGRQAARLGLGHPLRAAAAVKGRIGLIVVGEARAVADAERALVGTVHGGFPPRGLGGGSRDRGCGSLRHGAHPANRSPA